jgi:tripartite ATP-independent transporter DctM subunit
MTLSLIGFSALLLLLFLGVPIALGMVLIGFIGFAYIVGIAPAMAMTGQIAYETSLSYDLSVLPLFILMGNLINQSRLSEELYDASNAFLGHLRGGLAMATIVACGGFSAVCGSSLATAATMAKVSMPSMRRYGYADSLASGSIAAGGTLGILIPPSVIMVIYGIMTNTDIGKLFAAGILPGVLAISLYMAAIWLVTLLNPDLGPRGERKTMRERLKALEGVWGVLMLFLLVMGGIYFGFFTPTEAAGIGAFGAFVAALLRRLLTWRGLINSLIESARTTSLMFLVLIGAIIFSNFVNVAGMPRALSEWIIGLHVSPLMVVVWILIIYFLLGCVLESLSMVLLTVPVFFPIIQQVGLDPVWFGIIVVVAVEISLITPPVGLNVFVLKGVLETVPTSTIFKGVTPFIFADLVRVTILVLVPGISLLLPSFMK